MPWRALTLRVDGTAAEAFSDALLEAGAQSVALEPGGAVVAILAPGQDFESLTAKYGRPIGPFEKGRCHPYRASGNSTVASSEWTEAPPENIGAQ